jgi:methionyl-tRNA formyltransferase
MLLVVSYGKLLPQAVLDLTPLPVNIHPSLLPKHRGPNPILAPIVQGDKATGVTLMLMAERMDAGDILKQSSLPLRSTVTGGELERELVQQALVLLEDLLNEIHRPLKRTRQEEASATYTKKTAKEDTRIDWAEDARTIDRKVRAYQPRPRAYFELRGKKIFVESGELVAAEGNGSVRIGSLEREEGSVTLFLPKGRFTLKRVTPEGKGVMRAYDFVQGYRLKAGDPFN